LEQKYIELLERRVTELESRLATSSKVGPGEKRENGVGSGEDGAKSVLAGEKPKNQAKEKEKMANEEEKEDEFESDRHLVVLNSLDAELGEYTDKRADAAPKKAPKTDDMASTRAFIFRKFMRTRTIRGEDVLRPTSS